MTSIDARPCPLSLGSNLAKYSLGADRLTARLRRRPNERAQRCLAGQRFAQSHDEGLFDHLPQRHPAIERDLLGAPQQIVIDLDRRLQSISEFR